VGEGGGSCTIDQEINKAFERDLPQKGDSFKGHGISGNASHRRSSENGERETINSEVGQMKKAQNQQREKGRFLQRLV